MATTKEIDEYVAKIRDRLRARAHLESYELDEAALAEVLRHSKEGCFAVQRIWEERYNILRDALRRIAKGARCDSILGVACGKCIARDALDEAGE